MNKDKKTIAIVGGGFTGLTVAYELLKINPNLHVEVFEADKSFGGMAKTTVIDQKYKIEALYHHIFNTDTHLLALLKDLGLESNIIWKNSKVSIYRAGKISALSTPLDILKLKDFGFLNKLRFGITSLYLRIEKKWERLARYTVSGWMCKYAGEEVYNIIWKPLLMGKFGIHVDAISMAWLWGRINKRTNSRNTLGREEELGYVNGSLEIVYVKMSENILRNGGKINLNSRVIKLKQTPEDTVSLLTDKGDFSFDKVLVTTDTVTFSSMLMDTDVKSYTNDLAKMEYMHSICVLMTTSQDLSDYYWLNVQDINSLYIQSRSAPPAS